MTRKEFEESASIYYISVYCLKNYESWKSWTYILVVVHVNLFKSSSTETLGSPDHKILMTNLHHLGPFTSPRERVEAPKRTYQGEGEGPTPKLLVQEWNSGSLEDPE